MSAAADWFDGWRRILKARSETDPDPAEALEEVGRMWMCSAAGLQRFEDKYTWHDGDVTWLPPGVE